MRRYFLICLVVCCLGSLTACGMQKSQAATKNVSHQVHHKKTKHKNHKMSKQKQKEVIMDWENNIFNKLDTYFSTFQKTFNNKDLLTNLALSNKSKFDLQQAHGKLESTRTKVNAIDDSIKKMDVPFSLKTDTRVKLATAQNTLVKALNNASTALSDLVVYASETNVDMRDLDLKNVKDDISSLKQNQQKFERQLNEVNALYNIPPTHYFDKN